MQGSTSTFVTGIVIVGCTFAESPPNSDATYSRHCSFSIRHPRRVHEQHRSVTCEQVPVERLWVQISCFPDTLPHGASPRPVRPVTPPPHLPAALSLALRPCSLALSHAALCLTRLPSVVRGGQSSLLAQLSSHPGRPHSPFVLLTLQAWSIYSQSNLDGNSIK